LNYVTDTHSLVWYFTNDLQLSKKALKAFESTVKAGEIIVSTVVLAEILFIAKKGRIPLGFTKTVAQIEALANFEIVPLDLNVLKIAERIDAPLNAR